MTRSSAANQLPPAGSRIDPAADAGKLARVETNRPTLLITTSNNLPEACEAGGYAWVQNDTRVLKLQQCRPSATALTVTGGSGAGAALSITVPSHGITGNPSVRVQGVTGNTNANGTFLGNRAIHGHARGGTFSSQVISNQPLAILFVHKTAAPNAFFAK